MAKKNIIIIGSGLTALTLNYLIKKDTFLSGKFDISIIEARSRIGGRIYTLEGGQTHHTIEMGATWFGIKHQRFLNLLNELGVEFFEQKIGNKAHYEPLSTSPPYLVELPENSEPSLRLKGGTSIIIKELSKSLESSQIKLNEIVQNINFEDESHSVVSTDKTDYKANYVISTLPPYLLSKSIAIKPTVPNSLSNIMKSTHTWMGESIKIALVFEKPFWRNNNGSGTIFSNVGPIPEMYDHCNFDDDFYVLKGFLNSNYFSLSKEERLTKVLSQLQKYFKGEVTNYLSYEEEIWRNNRFTFAPYESHILPHQNNGNSVYQSSYFDNKFYIAGTETAKEYPGYMEGAIRSAEHIYSKLNALVK